MKRLRSTTNRKGHFLPFLVFRKGIFPCCLLKKAFETCWNVQSGKQAIDRLLEEIAYEHWHRMLFARFLAENNLLMYPDPDQPIPVLEECEELVPLTSR